MKQLLIGIIAIGSISAFAATSYNCDTFDLTRKAEFEGTVYSVKIDDEQGLAEVFASAVVPDSSPRKIAELPVTFNGNWYAKIDSDVSTGFTVSKNKQAGVLEIVQSREVGGARSINKRGFICTSVQSPEA